MRLRNNAKSELRLSAEPLTRICRIVLRRGTFNRRPVFSIALWTSSRGECVARLGEKELADFIVLLFRLVLTNRSLKNALRTTLRERLNLDVDSLQAPDPVDRWR